MEKNYEEDFRYKFVGIEPEKVEAFTIEEFRWVQSNLFNVCDNQLDGILIFSWIAGKFNLRTKRDFPILQIISGWQYGSRNLMLCLTKMFLGNYGNLIPFDSLAMGRGMMYIICNKKIPLCIESVRVPKGYHEPQTYSVFETMLRTCYDGRTVTKNFGQSPFSSYEATIPMIFSTETPLKDEGLRTRCISMKLDYSEKTEQVLKLLQGNSYLCQFGKLLKDEAEKFETFCSREEVEKRLADIKDDRKVANAISIFEGFKILKRIVPITAQVEADFILHLRKVFREEKLPEENIRLLLKLAENSKSDIGDFYINDERGHFGNFPELYEKIAYEHKITKSTLELLDELELKKQMKKIGFIKSYTTKRFNVLTKKAFVFIK